MTDKVKSGDVVVVYHSTEKMVGDFLSKPLNGTQFKSHRNTILGLDKESTAYPAEHKNPGISVAALHTE